MYMLERIPPKYFKLLLKYLPTIKGDTNRQVKHLIQFDTFLQRILAEAQKLIENTDGQSVKLDAIEQSLVRDLEQRDKAEAVALKQKIIQTKI